MQNELIKFSINCTKTDIVEIIKCFRISSSMERIPIPDRIFQSFINAWDSFFHRQVPEDFVALVRIEACKEELKNALILMIKYELSCDRKAPECIETSLHKAYQQILELDTV